MSLFQIHLTWLRAVSRADDTTRLKDIQHPSRAGVTEAQAALEERGAAFLFLTRHLDALDDEFLIRIGNIILIVFTSTVDGGLDLGDEVRRSLLRAMFDETLDLVVGNEGSLGAFELCRAGRQIEHISLAH